MLRKKEIAHDFLRLAAFGKVQEAFDKYVDAKFIHHNLHFKGDRRSLMLAMQENAHRHPNKIFETRKIIAEGDYVVTHSYIEMGEERTSITVVHIFKFHEDHILEMWDVGQIIPKDFPNENGAF